MLIHLMVNLVVAIGNFDVMRHTLVIYSTFASSSFVWF